jgi:class 3 adenylate cyclase/tetratricopeptide (TPR) repeat protein
MTCPNCGSANDPGRKFCGECGQPLARACPACGSPNPPTVKFCGECGTRLDEATAAAQPVQPAEPVAERRLVSVLFADLVGFTAASERRDAEETRDLLSRYFDLTRTIVERYGGTVEKFIGDAVMAVWGTPVAQEDDAERAVRASLEIVAAVPELGDQLYARAGVSTGEAAVTLDADGQGMVAGDLVNTASRIQAAAEQGAVLVGEATRRASEAAITYDDVGDHELKGKAEPVPLWRARRVVAARGGALRSGRLEPPFVGRERELRLVKDLFHATAEEGKARLVSALGIAGIGKSRLAWEFEKYIDGLADSIFWWRGRCLAYGEGVTYWALAEMIRTRGDIVEGEAPSTARPKLRAALEEYIADAGERDWIEPRLAHLLGLEESAAFDREDLFAAWRLYFERLAEHQPAILVFEDMQWADVSLLEFVEYLLEWSRNHPLYVLTLARPELMEAHPSWGAGKRNFTALSLEPLAPGAMEELIDGFVPGLPDDLRGQILDRSEGVPLYAVETVRMLLDRGLLEQVGDEYRPTGPIEALQVPETLHALIAARIDALEPEQRRLIQNAAVLGKTFTSEAVAHLSEVAPAELEPMLATLVRKEVLTLQADPRSPERGQYGFVQDLLRRVAYETLARPERKARHLAAARYLEGAWGPAEQEIAEVVSTHYMEAYRAAPDAEDAREIRDRASEMLVRAGERAASLAANEEAQRYYEQAVELADAPEEIAELRERAGRTAWRAGSVAAAREHFDAAIAAFESIGLMHPAARVRAAAAEIIWQEGKIDEALTVLEQSFVVLSSEEPDADLAAMAAQLGRLRFFAGRPEEAVEPIELALDIAESMRLTEIFAQALITKAILLGMRGRVEEGQALNRHALHVALENDIPVTALRAYTNLAAFAAEWDRYGEANELAEAGLELARRTGVRWIELGLRAGGATAQYWLGRWQEVTDEVDELLRAEDLSTQSVWIELMSLAPLFVERGDLEGAERLLGLLPDEEALADLQVRSVYLTGTARLLRARDQLDEAREAALAAVAVSPEIGIFRVKEALTEALEAALQLDDFERIEELLATVAALKPGAKPPFLAAQESRFRALLASRRGEPGVEGGLTSSAAAFRELEMPFWLAVTMLEHAEWLAVQSRPEEAAPLFDEAREIFHRLGAQPWLERLDQTAAGAPEPTAVS